MNVCLQRPRAKFDALLYYFFLPVFILCFLACAGRISESDSLRMEKEYELARLHFESQNFDSASFFIDKCLNIKQSYPPALYLQARILALEDNIYDRRKAVELLKTAIKNDNRNPDYHFTLAQIYERQEFFRNALEEYERTSQLDNSHLAALSKISELNIIFGLKFDDFEYFRKSQNALSQAIEYSPTPHYFYKMALTYYHLSQFDSSAIFAARALTTNAESSLPGDTYLLLGTDYVRMAKLDSAGFAFENAQKFISGSLASDMNDLRYLLPPPEYNRLVDETPFIRGMAVNQFWGKLDPDPTTEYNERKLEHYSRFVHAQLAFSVKGPSIDGWKTKRGEIYIRYGSPSAKTYTLDSSSDTGVVRQWIWTYDNLGRRITLIFEDTFLNGEFDYPYPKKNWTAADYDNDPSRIAAQLSYVNPQAFAYRPGAGELNFRYTLKQFRGPGAKTDLEVLFAVPHGNLNHVNNGSEARASICFRDVLRYPSWRAADSNSFCRDYENDTAQIADEQKYISDISRLSTFPDSLQYSISITDTISKFVGIKTVDIRVREFSRQKAELSDLILANEISKPPGKGRFMRDDIKIKSSLENKYRNDELIWIYFEIYNLTIGPDRQTYYSIKQTVSEQRSGDIIAELKSALKGEKLKEVMTSYIGKGSQKDENRIITCDISSLKPGRYELSIEIEDLNSDQMTVTSEEFEVYK